METAAVVAVLLVAIGWTAYAIRKASRTVDRIIDQETKAGPRVDGDRPGGIGSDPRGPAD